METSYSKGRDGWQGKTYITLTEHAEVNDEMTAHRGVGTRKLCISTSKNGRGLVTSASVSAHYPGGMMTHCFGFGGPGSDFSKRVAVSQTRCTEQAVRAQHETALAQAQQILAEAHAFYATKDQQKVMRDVVAKEIAAGAAPALATNQTVRELSGTS